MGHMDTTTISILIALAAVAVTLAGLIIGSFASLRGELRAINARLLALEQGQARLEGFREGFAEAVSLASAKPTAAAKAASSS